MVALLLDASFSPVLTMLLEVVVLKEARLTVVLEKSLTMLSCWIQGGYNLFSSPISLFSLFRTLLLSALPLAFLPSFSAVESPITASVHIIKI